MHMLARPPIKEANGCSSRAQTSHANNLQACRHTLGIKHTHTQTHMHTHTHVHTHTHTHAIISHSRARSIHLSGNTAVNYSSRSAVVSSFKNFLQSLRHSAKQDEMESLLAFAALRFLHPDGSVADQNVQADLLIVQTKSVAVFALGLWRWQE